MVVLRDCLVPRDDTDFEYAKCSMAMLGGGIYVFLHRYILATYDWSFSCSYILKGVYMQ